MATAITRCARCRLLHAPHCGVLVVTHEVVTPPPAELVVTRHGKYKDPEARKEYQRRKMREVRAARKAAGA